VFLITCITTAATLAWFNSGTFADDKIYMGGPVYLYFGDTNNKETIYAHSVGRNFIDQAYEAWASVTTYLIALDEYSPQH
jgi:hypothetical protein